ncbi:MAG: type II secretion system GspH family protein [Kiritimatiellales bacterium]|nr:type II secretion system GspH family protein [Kiritimatiellales bacterium]
MKADTENLKPRPSSGFTLLELMVAMVILTIAMSIAFQAFSGTIHAWKRGTEVVDGIKHGDFAMNQLASALDSTLYFFNPRKTYAFTIERGNAGSLPADTISFVTASSAFMPDGSPFAKGPHRLKLFIDDEDGSPALFASALPAIAEDEDEESEYVEEPMLVSRAVQGLEILIYDEETEDWTEDWEKENDVPERILIKIYVASEDEDEEPIVFTRVLEIPVAKSVEAKLTGPSKGAQTGGGTTPSAGGPTINVGGGNLPQQ